MTGSGYINTQLIGEDHFGLIRLKTESAGKGAKIADVSSDSPDAYPQNGIQDGYWYVFKETIPDVPSITVPGASMTRQQVSTMWGG